MKIGDFAHLGAVSVRMLRHYDALGLLAPARVDPWTHHREYGVDQLATLHRIVALKGLGFTLEEIGGLLRQDLPASEMRVLLGRRREQIAAELAAARARLAEVERRLMLLEETAMPTTEFVVRALPARTILARTVLVPEQIPTADVVEPLVVDVSRAITGAGGCPETGIAVYERYGEPARVTAGYLLDGAADLSAEAGVDLVRLPAVEQAVCGVHLGPLQHIGLTWRSLVEWIESHDLLASGPFRQVFLEAGPGPDAAGVPERTSADDQDDWVVELQQPVRHG